MRRALFLTLASLILLPACDRQENPGRDGSVNPVIGDISFIEKFGEEPDQATDEELRIRTHLKYVEKKLRQKDVSDLSPELKENRKKLLDLLREYRKDGEFPRNYEYPDQRKPCFIDPNGRICAVGYLIEQTAGKALAEKINSAYQYAKIKEMEMPALADWVSGSGLTLKECAMIQPSYWGVPPRTPYVENDISPAYGISSAVLGGLNASMITLNAIDWAKGYQKNTRPAIGLVSGAASTTLGIVEYDWEGSSSFGTNRAHQTLSLVNIGLGTASMIISGHALLTGEDDGSQTSSLNLKSFPTRGSGTGVALSWSKRF